MLNLIFNYFIVSANLAEIDFSLLIEATITSTENFLDD